MNPRLIVLDKILESVDIPPTVATKADRVRFQKTIYLAQEIGVELGYKYGWYLNGPYSTSLTRDYYELEDALAIDPNSFSKYSLTDDVLHMLKQKLAPLLEVPDAVKLDQYQWLELLASIAFLRHETTDQSKINSVISVSKPQLFTFVSCAWAALPRTASDAF